MLSKISIQAERHIHVSVGTRARVRHDFDRDDIGSLGHTVLRRCNSSSAMGAVAVSIGTGISTEGSTPASTTTELLVCSVDTSVNDVDIDASSSNGIVRVWVGECGDRGRGELG